MQKTIIIFLAALMAFPALQAETPKENEMAPDIIQMGINGDTLRLSDLKGKLVLIDFWASWCAPCRKENPNLVAAYSQYKNASFKNSEGFEIFSVSLDQNQTAWEMAIKKDNLQWPNHVCDLKGWRNAAAVLYGINSVPASFLIDGNGEVVATNLRGDALEEKLEKLLKKESFWGRLWN